MRVSLEHERIVVTGGAGFIGSNLVKRLLAEGASVVVVDDFSTGRLERLPPAGPNLEIVHGSVCDADLLSRLFSGASFVFHLACRTMILSTRDPGEDLEVNARGTLNVLLAARQAAVRRLVYTSSASIYGNGKALPIDEDSPVDLLSPYAISKHAGEAYCQLFHKLHGLSTVALRLSNVFGPGQDPSNPYAGVVAKFFDAALAGEAPRIHGDGEQTRDFTAVDDVVEALLQAGVSPQAEGQVYNVGTSRETSVNRLVQAVLDVTGIRVEPIHVDLRDIDTIRRRAVSIARIGRELGWAPRLTLEDGLLRVLEWMRSRAEPASTVAQPVQPSASVLAAKTISVVGLGKIGLPLAAQFATRGHTVIGCDVDPQVVASINAGRSHVREEAGLAEIVAQAVASGQLRATLDTATAVSASDTVVVIVPLMVDADKQLDFGYLDAATRAVAAGLRRGTLVVFETTLPVGTTRGRLATLLEVGSGLTAGRDFWLAFSPERVYSGRILTDLGVYPKVVGGIDAESTRRAAALYRSALNAEIIEVSNVETAEFTKLAETTFRDVNFALANQLAIYASAREVSAVEAFAAANTQPFSDLHAPNIGIGGHCIPVYPHFLLSDAAEDELGLLRLSRQTNDAMAAVAIQRLARDLGGLAGRRVLLLGLAYRENVKELAFSVALRLTSLLREAGAEVLGHDPLFTSAELGGLELELVEDLNHPPALDAIIIQAFHDEYRHLDWRRFSGLEVVFDGRGHLDPRHLAETNARYRAIGQGSSR